MTRLSDVDKLARQAVALHTAVQEYAASQFDEWQALHALMQWLRRENYRTRGDANAIWLRPDHFSTIKSWLPMTSDGQPGVAIHLKSATLRRPYSDGRELPNPEHIMQLALHPELITASWHRDRILEFAGLTEAEVMASMPA